jgi:ABC-type multidrug transport system fused ATPase/permease subunit
MNFFVFALINKLQGHCVPFLVIGLIIPFLFGPLTFWPNVEFWWPEIQIFGALSVGTLLLLLTIAGFMGISIVSLIYGWRSIQMAILSLMAVTAISAANRLNRVFSSTCELGH